MDRVRMYDSEERREAYQAYMQDAYGEQWWYQANPQYPSVSYTTEAPSVNVRFNGWMMYDYGITGDLYWETAMNHQFTRSYEYEYIQDQFDTAMRYPSSNGEGKLLYAGREYGIYGPVGTVRLHAVRDAHEDYDLLYELEELYATRGVTGEQFNSVLQFLVEDLYVGTKLINSDTAIETILQSREALNTLFKLYYENGVVVESYETAKGIATMKLSALDTTVLKANGVTLTGDTQSGVTHYVYSMALDKNENVLTITASTGEISNSFTFDLGAKNVAVNAETLLSKYEIVAGDGTVAMDGENACVKVAPTSADAWAVALNTTSLNVDNSYKTLTLRIYVYGTEDVTVTLWRKRSRDSILDTVRSFTLKAGWNEIKLDVSEQLKCTSANKLALLQFETTDTSAIGFGDIILVG